MMRRLAAALALGLGLAAGAAAQPAEDGHELPPLALTADQRAVLAKHPVLRLGIEKNWAPIEFVDEHGRYGGVIASYMAALENQLGIRFELVQKASYSEVLKAFETGEIDVLSALSRTPARLEAMRFTKPYIQFTNGIIVRNNEAYVERLSDFPAGKKLAAVIGYASSENAAGSNPQLIPVPVRNTEEALFAVSTGRADIAIASLAAAYYLTQSRGLSNLRVAANFDEFEQTMGMAVRPGLEEMIPLFDAALAAIPPAARTAMREQWTTVPIDRGVARRTVVLWTTFGLVTLLLMGAWVLSLLRQQSRNRRLLARAESAEAQFRAMIDAMPAVFWILRARAGQSALYTRFGHFGHLLPSSLPGLEPQAFETALQHLPVEDQQRFHALLQKHGRDMSGFRFEHRYLGGPGDPQWVLVQALPQLEKTGLVWYGCTLDISERKALEAQLETSRNQLEELAAGVPGALWQFRREADGSQRYTYMSDGIVGVTGRTAAETNALMMDRSFVSVHPDDQHILKDLMQRLTERPGIEEGRYRLRTTAGEWKWVQVAARAMPVEADGAIVWNGITLDATRLHETEGALRFERQRLQDLADNLHGALWRMRRTGEKGFNFEYVSERVVDVAGRTAAEIMSGASQPLEQIVPEDRPRLLGALDRSAATGAPFEIEYSVVAASGRIERLFARAAVRIEDGVPVWTGVLFNVSERHRLEVELAEARARLEDITDTFPGAIWQMQRRPGESVRFTYMSQNIRSITGRPPEATLSTPDLPFQVMADEDRERAREVMETTARDQSSAKVDYRLRTASGVARWVTASFNARTQPDGTTVWNGVLLDAEETKRLEAELRAATDRAEAASRAKTRFLANMSHEIRTPMNAVIGLAHIAMTSETTPVQQERIGKIHKAGKALLKLLNDILEYARLDAGKFTPVVAAFDLDEVLAALRLFCLPLAETKSLAFTIDCEPGLERHWRGDATRIQQVLLNLVSNAIKFTDTGRVGLAVRRLQGAESGLCFHIEDTGIGMSSAEVQRVFQAFEQASGEIERRHGGSGLGLSISRELVVALGGRISVESTPGAGSRFTVELPLEPAAAASPAAPLGDLAPRLARLAAQLEQRDAAGSRNSLSALRMVLIPQGLDAELHALENRLAAFDIEAAQIELARLAARWGSKSV